MQALSGARSRKGFRQKLRKTFRRFLRRILMINERKRKKPYSRRSKKFLFRCAIVVSVELAREPRPRHSPVDRDGRRRDAQHFGRLFNRQTAEIPEFDNAVFGFIVCGELFQLAVEREQSGR